jgi:hypothetical protein
MSQQETNKIILDAAYPLDQAAKLMALKHPNDVVRLHDQGRITLRMRRVRGEKGRPVLLGAEIVQFNKSLPAKPRKQRLAVPSRPVEDLPEPAPRALKKRGERRVGKAVAESFDD